MSEPFNVNQYWLERGRTYAGEERLALEYHRVQERHILQTLREAGLTRGNILELGCGFGRISRLLAEQFPEAKITALDLSPDQLANARQYCEGHSNITFQPYDFYTDEPFPGGQHDAAIAIEVFLHHPPEVIRRLIQRLQQAAPVIVHLDWFEAWSGPLPPHVWIHDYPAYHRELGWQVAVLPVPAKVEGKQQVLFVAAPLLPAALRPFQDDGLGESTAADSPLEAGSVPDSWEHQVAHATADLCRVIPPGDTFILVDGNEWGINNFPEGRRARPFLEKDGQNWGPPADDAAAVQGLEDLRKAGAAWLVIGWNAAWWLDHYQDWHQHLRREFSCVLENDRVVIFKLNS